MGKDVIPTQQQLPTSHPLTSGGILQRKCTSCGQHAIAQEECETCKKKRPALQRKARAAATMPHLTVYQPGDRFEQEADRIAEAVIHQPAIAAATKNISPRIPLKIHPISAIDRDQLQRQSVDESEEEEDDYPSLLQPKSTTNDRSSQVLPSLSARLNAAVINSQPLTPATRSFFEPRFGQDFSQVRVHTDPTTAQSLNAQAFTYGHTIVFDAGKYAPETRSGQRRLAHELTHVIQQTSAPTTSTAEIQRAPAGEEQPSRPGPTPDTVAEPAAADDEPVAADAEEILTPLIVEDDTDEVTPEQMRKSQFLAELQTAVCAAAEAALVGTHQTTRGCPHIRYWFAYYRLRDSQHIERAIRRYAPETATARNAREYMPAVVANVQRGVATWIRTGAVPEVPAGMPTDLLSGMPTAASSAVLLKAQSGHPEQASDLAPTQRQLGDGQPLDSSVRSRMESAFGTSFAQVRQHSDGQAQSLATRFSARAFTVGEHIAFGAGEYHPGTPIGDALIAHELAHVMQQRGADAHATSAPPASTPQTALEADADFSAIRAVTALWQGVRGGMAEFTRAAVPRLRSGLQLQRCSCDRSSSRPSGSLPTTLPTFDCSTATQKPLPDIAREIGSTGILGVTKMASPGRFNINLQFQPSDETCDITSSPSLADFALEKFMATAPGTYDVGTETPRRGRCRRRSLTQKLEITSSMADKLKQAEGEHCEDHRRVYALTFGKARQVHRDIGNPFCAAGRSESRNQRCQAEFTEYFRTRVGIDFSRLASTASCLERKTGTERDDQGTHTVQFGPGTSRSLASRSVARDCTSVTYTPDHTTQLTDVGTRSAADVVQGCGEP